jgi:uncharacterized membrane protein SirB2
VEFYPQLRLVHFVAVIASGSLFLLRGVLVQAGYRLAMAAPMRYLSYFIDTVLLITGAWLFFMLPSAVFANGWLAAKLVLLVIYIVLGTLALRRGRTAGIRRLCFLLALAVFGCIFAIARTHDPFGPIRFLAELLV